MSVYEVVFQLLFTAVPTDQLLLKKRDDLPCFFFKFLLYILSIQ